MSIITALKDLLPADRIIEGEKLKNRIAHVWHPEWEFKGKLVVIPINTNEVCQIMKLCYSFEQAVIPHGGLTNLVHSTDTSPNDVIISFERMNKVEEIDTTNRTITVQAGAILQNIQNQVRDKNLYFPLDFGARGSCQIGGCISTNAGGLKVIRYGMTRDNVLGLEVVLPDGTILSSLNKMIKNNAGYDLKQLFIGSEGTLGLITRAVIKLKEIPRSFHSAFAGIENFKN